MRRAEALAILHDLLPRLTALGVACIDLVGSVARDEARVDSDVDVVVTFGSAPSLAEHLRIVDVLEEALGRRVDVIPRGRLKARALAVLEREAVHVA